MVENRLVREGLLNSRDIRLVKLCLGMLDKSLELEELCKGYLGVDMVAVLGGMEGMEEEGQRLRSSMMGRLVLVGTPRLLDHRLDTVDTVMAVVVGTHLLLDHHLLVLEEARTVLLPDHHPRSL